MEYRNYNRIDLTMKRGWDTYLPKASGTQCPDPVIVTTPPVVTVSLNVDAGGSGQPRVAGFFAPRTVIAVGAAVAPALPTVEVDLNESPPVHHAESFCDRVLSCVKLVVSDLHVSLKADEIRMLVMLRMNHEFMGYMRVSYLDTPLSEFKEADTIHTHGGVDTLDDDEDDE
jgi:hypothetical protein